MVIFLVGFFFNFEGGHVRFGTRVCMTKLSLGSGSH